MSVDCLSVAVLMAAMGAVAGETVPLRTYTGQYLGEVVPTPQQATYHEVFVPLYDLAAQRPLVRLVLRANAESPERLGAVEIGARVSLLAGREVALPLVTGPPAENPRLRLEPLAAGPPTAWPPAPDDLPPHAEGYTVRAEPSEAPEALSCVARQSLGLYWACQSLLQLTTVHGERVVLRAADLTDYPVFSLRSFKIGGQRWEMIEDMARWCASAKFNCFNLCYTTLGRDQWPNPSEEYRALVKRLCDLLLPRGQEVMLFVNPYYLWKEHIQISDPNDLAALAETCSLALQRGARRVMLCLDDFASEPQRKGPRLYIVRHPADREAFHDDLAEANAYLLNDLYRRLKARFPECQLLTVLPYYWLPRDRYREEGERYLREVGRRTPSDLVIVWTGPVVRSKIVRREDVEKYTALIGRKPFLWDNTLYAWHTPPHYFLDPFQTQYPERFWELTELGCHYNAGGGEAYKVGLYCVADYLWNPTAYQPEAALRKALTLVAGAEAVEPLLQFRDHFYFLRDEVSRWLGKPQALLKIAQTRPTSPLEAEDLAEIRAVLEAQEELMRRIEEVCPNEGLVAEARERYEQFAGYREALEALAKLPAPDELPPRNLHPNPDCETVEGGRPVGFGTYAGAGELRLRASAEAHQGKRAVEFAATEWYIYPEGRRWINVALCLTGSDGYTGDGALEVEPFTKYYFRFWAKSDCPRWEVSVVGWPKNNLTSAARQILSVRPEEIDLSGEWRCYTGSFLTGADTARVALKLGLLGYEDEGAKLGRLWVDDVYVGPGKPPPVSR